MLQAEQYAAFIPWLLGLSVLAVLGLLAIQIVIILRLRGEYSFASVRSRKFAYCDYLPYDRFVDDGVLLTKGGALMAGWTYQGHDLQSMSNTEKNTLTQYLNNAALMLGTGYMVHVCAIRRELPDYPDMGQSYFPDLACFLMDNARRQAFTARGTMFGSMYMIVLTYAPPSAAAQKAFAFLASAATNADQLAQRTRRAFDETCAAFESNLQLCFTQVERLRRVDLEQADGTTVTFDAFLSCLSTCCDGERVMLRAQDAPADTLLGGAEFYKGLECKVGEKFVRVVDISGLAGATVPGMLTALTELGCEYRFCTRFIFLDASRAAEAAEKIRKKWNQKKQSFFAQLFNVAREPNRDAVAMVDDAEDAKALISSGHDAFGYLTQNLIFMDRDREALRERCRMAENVIRALGLKARTETYNTAEAYFGSLPGEGASNVRRPFVTTSNFADIIPLNTPWAGSEYAPCKFYPELSPALMYCASGMAGNILFRLNLHAGDLGHTLIFGPSGAGKSTLLCMLAAQLRRYRGMKIFSFDKGMSMYTLCMAAGGRHFNPGGSAELSFCPLESVAKAEGQAQQTLAVSFATTFIENIITLNTGKKPQPQTKNEIEHAIMALVKAYRSTNGGVGVTLSDFATSIQDTSVRQVLEGYCVGGRLGTLLDAEEDGLSLDASFCVFEIESLMNLPNEYCLPVLDYIFYRIEAALDGSPAAIFLDEAWIMLGHEVFKEKIREWLKVLRKKNCMVLMATQSLSDAAASGMMDVLNENCATKIFLANAAALTSDTARLYMTMGLNHAQLQIIADARPKRDYFIKQGENSRLFQLGLSKLELAFAGVSDPVTIGRIHNYVQTWGSEWVEHYLQQDYGLDVSADRQLFETYRSRS